MIICRIKLSHDGAVALIDDGKLIFSCELEKLDNMPRHANFSITTEKVEDILLSHGYSFKTIDSLVFDGWDYYTFNARVPIDKQEQLSFKVPINAENSLGINKLADYGHFVSMTYSYENGRHGSLNIRSCPAGKP